MHAMIRNNCSNLRADLFINHLRHNPVYHCSHGNEDASHLFFEWDIYTNQRVILFRSTRLVHPLSTNEPLVLICLVIQTFQLKSTSHCLKQYISTLKILVDFQLTK